MENKKFMTSKEIKDYCKELGLTYEITIRYLTHYNYLNRIFKGIFYVRSVEERKFNKTNLNYLEIISEALKIKGVKKWYFGLETALKFNNVTHEYFTIIYILNDKLFRAKEINILGHKVKFFKIAPKLFSFGIIKKETPFSDLEKTILDLIYLKKVNLLEIKELLKKANKKKISKYSKNYDGRTIKILKEAYDK